MLEVAVIGAGVAGLVASHHACHLLGQGLRPSIFEAAKQVRGAWSSPSTSTSRPSASAQPSASPTVTRSRVRTINNTTGDDDNEDGGDQLLATKVLIGAMGGFVALLLVGLLGYTYHHDCRNE